MSHRPRWHPPTAVIRYKGASQTGSSAYGIQGLSPGVTEILRQADLFPANLAKVLELWQTLVVPLPSHLQMSTPSERLHQTPDSHLGEMTRTVPGGEQWPRCEEATPFSLECSPPWPSAGAADSQRSTLWTTFPHGCDADAQDS